MKRLKYIYIIYIIKKLKIDLTFFVPNVLDISWIILNSKLIIIIINYFLKLIIKIIKLNACIIYIYIYIFLKQKY